MLNIPCLGLVPMNTKILLGLTLVAVLVMTVASPAIAEAITGIKKTEIKVKGDEIDKLKFHLDDKVDKPTFGGYAIFTDGGAVVAYTSHGGVYDSTSQTAPTSNQVDIQVGAIAAVCGVSPDVACGDEWHSHLVVPDDSSPYCDFAAISELTFNEPADKVKAKGKHVEGKDIALGTTGFVGAISGKLMDFTVGDPYEQEGQAFPLVPAFTASGLKAICINGATDLTETQALCLDLGVGDQAAGLEFIAIHNDGGDFRLDKTEFPYSDALWTQANTNVNDSSDPNNSSVVGGGELRDWFTAKC